jgi:hypothetical protein
MITKILSLFLVICFVTGQETFIDSSKVKNPQIAWKLGAIPGVGQLYNQKYGKSVAFIATQSYAYKQFVTFKNDGNISKRNTYAWWVFGLWVLSMLDAYVDAQLTTFPVEIETDESQPTHKEEN